LKLTRQPLRGFLFCAIFWACPTLCWTEIGQFKITVLQSGIKS